MTTRDTQRPRGRGGFSLVELLVVIGVIALLIGILVPTISNVMRKGRRQTMVAQLQMIGTALEAYKGDFGDYPRVTDLPLVDNDPRELDVNTGAVVLARALIGPGPAGTGPVPTDLTLGEDGAEGPGFRLRRNPTVNQPPQGRTWGPYLPAERFKLRNPDFPENPTFTLGRAALTDGNDRPILYMPARTPKPARFDTALAGPVASPWVDRDERSLFDANDVARGDVNTNPTTLYFRHLSDTESTRQLYRLRVMLGDADGDGLLDANEKTATEGPYVLWTAGEDGQFGPIIGGTGNVPSPDERKSCDDVTNFPTGQ